MDNVPRLEVAAGGDSPRRRPDSRRFHRIPAVSLDRPWREWRRPLPRLK